MRLITLGFLTLPILTKRKLALVEAQLIFVRLKFRDFELTCADFGSFVAMNHTILAGAAIKISRQFGAHCTGSLCVVGLDAKCG
jgi:hypothetical protein